VRRFLSQFTTAMICFCVATVLAQLIAIGTLWFKGTLDEDRLYRVLAALHGIDIFSLHAEIAAQELEPKLEQVSHDAIVRARTRQSLDLDLRESALDKGLLDLVNRQNTLRQDQELFGELKQTYDTKLETFAEQGQEESLQQLQRTLEAIQPRQAKEQIVMMLEDGAMNDIVMILTRMPTDKRKKIIGEFKQDEDAQRLHEILTEIRRGDPLTSQIQEGRDQLRQLGGVP
jgi:hypothetical protein